MDFIHETKIYKVLVKIFKVVKESDVKIDEETNIKIETIKSEDMKNSETMETKEVYDFPSGGERIETKEIVNNKNNRWNFEDTKIEKEIESPFYKNMYFVIGFSIVCFSLIYIYWDSISELFKNSKPDEGGNAGISSPTQSPVPEILEPREQYNEYFVEKEENILDYTDGCNKIKKGIVDYIDVENIKWESSPTTPKASTSKLPKTQSIMLPISKK